MRIIHVQHQRLNIGISTFYPANKERWHYGGMVIGSDKIILETRWFGKEREEYYVGYDDQDNIIAMLPALNCFVRFDKEVEK